MAHNSPVTHHEYIASVVGGRIVSDRAVDPSIAQSWRRSLETYQLDPGRTGQPRILTRNMLREHQEPMEPLLQIAKASMLRLHEQLRDLGYVLLLTDPSGVATEFIGNPVLDRELRQAGLYLGSCWSEIQEGTCAIGTSIVEKRPITVHKSEHFRARNVSQTCTAAPIFDPSGDLLGTLDVSALYSPDDKKSQHLVLQLVTHTARMIENIYFLRQFKNHLCLIFSPHQELLDVRAEDILALNEQGIIVGANRDALAELAGGDLLQVINRNVSDIFDVQFEELVKASSSWSGFVLPLRVLKNSQRYFAYLRSPESERIRPRASRPAATTPALPKSRGARRALDLDAVAGSDPEMLRNVRIAKRVMNNDVAIMLQGETGTGKEVFARAIHDAGNRGAAPFVAINCAAIPETLIESELFGYKEGAFTGARSKGMRGKILQSSGGTLFLDEIGDMPLQLQSRLLRVLAEKEITPLGCESPLRVDLRVICATHRNLLELVEKGEFRADLYFRLNGVKLLVPSLRSRQDREMVIRSMLEGEAIDLGRPEASISDEAFALLERYHWPGNFRQLRNVLRSALSLNESGVVSTEDIPYEVAEAVYQKYGVVTRAPSPDSDLQNLGELALSAREALVIALRRHKWNVTETARDLGTCRATIYRKMKKLNIVPPNELG